VGTTNDPKEFARRLDRVAIGLANNVEQMMKAAATNADEELVRRTPVDTGRARSNWIASVGAPSTFAKINAAPKAISEKVRLANAQAAQASAFAQARPVIAAWTLAQGGLFITNNVIYVQQLDRGSSNQAPRGMSAFARAAVRRTVNIFGRLLLTVR